MKIPFISQATHYANKFVYAIQSKIPSTPKTTEPTNSLLLDSDLHASQEATEEFHTTLPTTKRIAYKVGAWVHPAHIAKILKRLGYVVVPQPVRSVVWQDYAPESKQFPTSYLNGLRGLTAIKVFTFHYWMAFTDFTHMPYGMDARHTNVFLLPIIRYFYTGFTSHIFFGLAGYLTSLRLFQLIDRGDVSSQSKILTSVAGSLFRRMFRLYIPVCLITWLMATYIYSGLYEKNRWLIWNHVTLFPGQWNEEKPRQAATYWAQLRFWAHEMFVLSNINIQATIYPLHDQHLWSILCEMRASIHLYGCLMALMLCKREVRLVLLLIIAYIYCCWNHWEVWVYILGAFVAQLDVILTSQQEKPQPPLIALGEPDWYPPPPTSPTTLQPAWARSSYTAKANRIVRSKYVYAAFRFCGFFTAFYLLSFPIRAPDFYSPGYETLKKLIPRWVDRKDKYYSNFGTTLLLLLLVRSNPDTSKWRKFLSMRIPQYLGTISFGLYLTQALLLHAFGYLIPHWICWAFGAELIELGNVWWVLLITIGWAISLVCCVAFADVWTREVEGRCIKLVKKLEKMCFKQQK